MRRRRRWDSAICCKHMKWKRARTFQIFLQTIFFRFSFFSQSCLVSSLPLGSLSVLPTQMLIKSNKVPLIVHHLSRILLYRCSTKYLFASFVTLCAFSRDFYTRRMEYKKMCTRSLVLNRNQLSKIWEKCNVPCHTYSKWIRMSISYIFTAMSTPHEIHSITRTYTLTHTHTHTRVARVLRIQYMCLCVFVYRTYTKCHVYADNVRADGILLLHSSGLICEERCFHSGLSAQIFMFVCFFRSLSLSHSLFPVHGILNTFAVKHGY